MHCTAAVVENIKMLITMITFIIQEQLNSIKCKCNNNKNNNRNNNMQVKIAYLVVCMVSYA